MMANDSVEEWSQTGLAGIVFPQQDLLVLELHILPIWMTAGLKVDQCEGDRHFYGKLYEMLKGKSLKEH